MAEITNENVFDPTKKKFVDFAGLDYFWEKAKKYTDDADAVALADAKKYTDDTITDLDLANSYDAKGAADTALADAKKYTDDTITGLDLANTYDAKGAADDALDAAKGYADGLNTAMDDRVKVLEAIDHEKLASDASAAAVATVLDGAPESFDTLKEIAQWISDSETAADAADLVTRVSALEAIDHDAYKAADTKVLDDAKAYADGLADNYDAAGSAEAAKAAAIAQAKLDAAETLQSYYTKTEADAAFDTKGSADTALATAKKYTDDTITGLDLANTYEAKGTAANLDAALKSTLEAYADQAEADAITASNTYAKTYTDLLFASITFATNPDIDTIFDEVQPEA